ncbi:MAG: hypothetical protein IT559_08605 [Alphaproteobacteria bacterium]|nr:hypothetical protein [Alphaproteobacteria bacterium]
MKHKSQRESGNALIYVLIAVALFAALSMTLGRQTDTSEAGTLSGEKAELAATRMISYAAQTKSAIDQMLFGGTAIDDLDFTAPTDAAFETEPPANYLKVYHPVGGGLTPATLPAESIGGSSATPPPGWYLGRFNTVDWTKSAAEDVILLAYQIRPEICARINLKITGSTTIPTMSSAIKLTLIDDAVPAHGGANTPLTTDTGEICPECRNQASLCVQEGGLYAFYTIIADQ